MVNFTKVLHVDKNVTSQRRVYPKRKARIDEATSWIKGTVNNRKYYTLWEKDRYRVALGKPGKESLPGYSGKTNPNDMKPTIFLNSSEISKAATFKDIVEDLEKVGKTHSFSLELLGCLLFRSAFLLDHKEIKENNSKNIYRYFPSMQVINTIKEKVPIVYGVPVEVFVHYLDAIALNEDVKYDFLGYDLERKNVGGRNNMLTYVNLIAVISGKKPLYTLTGPLLRSGVAAISLRSAFESLPFISD